MELKEILAKENLSRDDLIYLLGLTDFDQRQEMYKCAYKVKEKYVGRVAYYRGLIEFSNQCIKNCLYCGIRRDNREVERFNTAYEDILSMGNGRTNINMAP